MNKILLVEDDRNSADVLGDIFEFDDIPAELVTVYSGEEAIQRAIELTPLLILMDLRLPGIDGLETAECLKSNPITRDIPVWALTAYATSEDEKRARDVGCGEYITKPVNSKELSDRLRQFLRSTETSETMV